MADNKVKISNILESQLPEFILGDNPLFREFLEQFYVSQEHEYGTVDLADNIGDLKDIGTFAKLTYATSVNKLTTEALNLDETINVTSTAGYPAKWGLLKIDDEIITYTGKTATSFTGCVRGFSGIDQLEGELDQEFLIFKSTRTASHKNEAIVQNLSLVFLAEFYRKHKIQFLPGFEERQFQGVAIDNILSRARDFYSSKGTESSLKILFDVLYNKHIEVLTPFDNTILASGADFNVSDIIVVEALEGDPLNLKSTTVLQGSTTAPTAKGTVARVDKVLLNRKVYYKLFFTSGTIENNILVSKRTKVLTQAEPTDTTLTVDSTLGFPASGSFYSKGTLEPYSEVTYTSKSSNQFFGCVGITTTLLENDSIIDGLYLYGYEDNDVNKLVQMRVTGSISGVAKNADTSSLYAIRDRLAVRHLGEKVEESDVKFNRWFYNNVTFTDIGSFNGTTIDTEVDHFLNVDDRVDIVRKASKAVEVSNVLVSEVNSRTRFQIGSGSLPAGIELQVKRRPNIVNSNLLDDETLGNIQNTFVDKDNNTYVAFSGYPGYASIDIVDRSKTVTTSDIDETTNTITIANHNFLNGEKVFYEHLTPGGSTGISTGNYFIQRINNNDFRLALSQLSLSNGDIVDISGLDTATDQHKFTPSVLNTSSGISSANTGLTNQKNFKRIYKTPKATKKHLEITGPVGVALNGVELHSPASSDSIFWGQIDFINVLNEGSGYNVTNPPNVTVQDTVGKDAVTHGNFEGKIEDIIITSNGFNYAETPVVTISGGNGTEAKAEARMRGFTHSVSFDDFALDLPNDKITTTNEHRFLDGEEVTYVASGLPVGIGSTNVGFNTSRMTSGGTYFIAKISDTELKLASTRERALKKVDLIDINNPGNQTHTLRSRMIRKVIDRIVVDSTDDFGCKSVVVDGVAWPPADQKNIFSSFVGVNTENNYIYARNHPFKNGDNVLYSFDGTAIGGLDAAKNYKVTVVDSDRFMLSEAGTATTISSVNYDRKIYTNITSVGVGTHTFKYPDIVVNINGIVSAGDTSVIESYYNASATPVVRGRLSSVFIRNGGVGYGSSDIINFQKNPTVQVETGFGAEIRVIIADGKISSAYISNKGSEYTTPPTVNVVGAGKMAKLTVTIANGKVNSVTIVDPGSGYKEGTYVEIVPTGKGARCGSEVHEWKINDIERYKDVLSITNNKDLVKLKSNTTARGNKVASFYPGQAYRNNLDDNIFVDSNGNLKEKTADGTPQQALSHSPIIGWAYDGNPIYGPYGNSNAIPAHEGGSKGGVTKITSSYSIDKVTSDDLRPNRPDGFFVQDFVYKASGMLDEFNGRYIVNDDFPNGQYCYFSPLDGSNDPAFPYVTYKHHNQTDDFNYDLMIDQSDEFLNSGLYKRNVTHIGLDDTSREYPFLQDPLDSKVRVDVDHVKGARIDSITVSNSGKDYKVGEQVILSDNTIDAEIDAITGGEITRIDTTETELENTIFKVKDNVITGFTTIPHGFLDTDIIEITGISSASYKNIEGFRQVGVNTLNTTLAVAMGATTVTGLGTHIQLDVSTVTRKFAERDVITIGNEQIQIRGFDDVNNRYLVNRNFNGTTGTTHAQGAIVVKNPKEFSFTFDKKLENKNIEFANEKTFAASAVGIGSTVTSNVVGFAGSTNITVAIPDRAIYIPAHGFKTGEQLNLVSVGGTIHASATAALNNTFTLESITTGLFAVNLSSDYLGIKTSKTGNRVFFTNSTDGISHTLSDQKNNLTGIVKKVSARVGLSTNHSLRVNDEVTFNVVSDRLEKIKFVYNEFLDKLVVRPQTFTNAGVVTGTTNEITIPDHGLKTGDIVLYTNAVGVATPLQDNRQYHVIKISDNRFQLAESQYAANTFPHQPINLTEKGHGTHSIAQVNPPLMLTNGSKTAIGVSDPSLDGYDIEFYTDKHFQNRYASTLIERDGVPGDSDPNTQIVVTAGDELPKSLYYRVEGIDANFTDTYPTSVNEIAPNYSNITVVDSKYNQSYRLTSVGNTTFDFTLVGSAETTSYTSAGWSTASYSTNSAFETGGIKSVKIVNPGIELTALPILTSIGSTTGTDAVLRINGSEIGEIRDTSVIDQGIEFLEDKTLQPKADTNVVLQLRNTLTLGNVGIVTAGRDYTTAPTIIAVGRSDLAFNAVLQGSALKEVEIIENGSNLSEDLRLFATNNSNGVRVTEATSNFKLNTLKLRSPVSGFTKFPFEIGDKIFVENVLITNAATADGYNSSDYDYQYFTVTARNTVSGTESITYSIAGIGNTGGTYNSAENAQFGRVIKVEDLAILKPEFADIKFTEKEKIFSDTDPAVFGEVALNGWDLESRTLKLTGVQGDFEEGGVIRGNVGNYKATISNKYVFDFDLTVGSDVMDRGVWDDNVGYLNFDLQRLHDNDYYQRFAYSIRGEIPYETWSEAVKSLDHTAGYKDFSDFEIVTYPPAKTGDVITDTDLNLNVELSSKASVWCRNFYDSASEDTDNSSLSKIIIFDNKVITDYNESRTNLVLTIDDISPQFTGVGNSAGQNVGLTTFAIFNNNESLLYKTIEPGAGINTFNGAKEAVFTIPDHNFNTGERLTYDPTNNGVDAGQHLSIVQTSSTGSGLAATDRLPKSVYAIRLTKDTFKVAVGKSEAESDPGLGVTVTNAVGIGSTHSFATEVTLASTRAVLSIDNVIQSPLARLDVNVGLSKSVGIGSTQIEVWDTTNIQGNTLIRLNDEIVKVTDVGVGATDKLNVDRAQMGTVAGIHTIGAGTTILTGDYQIKHGRLHFRDAPYGPIGINSTRSTFAGRIFYRVNYDKNLVIDDVSETFGDREANGDIKNEFDIKSNGIGVSGINGVGPGAGSTAYGAILVDNIFQKPFYGDVGSLLLSDYRIIGTGETISFVGPGNAQGGTSYNTLPKGGIINEFAVGVGSNYQVPRAAVGAAVVNGQGVITSVTVGIGSTGLRAGGAGHIFPPKVSIADTVGNGSGGIVTAIIGTAGTVTGFSVVAGGSGYTQANPPKIVTDYPAAYKNMKMVGGAGTDAKMDVVVGTGGSVISFNISDRGFGYKIGDVLSLEGLPFDPVGVGSTAFQITVRNRFQDKFAGWTFGQLLELDDFSAQFNGFRTTFLLTRTITSREYYSIVAQQGSGIVLANNLMIFLNDVLQEPVKDYEFNGGTRISFKEAPKAGSKFKIYLYVGSDQDYVAIDVDETIKPGDRLRLQREGTVPSQTQRVIYELIASDTVETETYAGVGIVTDTSFKRPVEWCKQTSDLTIDGVPISKERDYLEPQYMPTTNIIKSVGINTTKLFVNNTWAFSKIDDLGQTLNDIKIRSQETSVQAEATATMNADVVQSATVTNAGLGYREAPEVWITPTQSDKTGITTATATSTINAAGQVTGITITSGGGGYTATPNVFIEKQSSEVEKIQKVSYAGDFGTITSIGGSATGINTTTPMIEFYLRPDLTIYDPTPNAKQISRPGITVGDRLVVRNTFLGAGVTSIDGHVDDVVCTSNNFVDNVYIAHQVVSVGTSEVRVSCNVDSLTGINTATQPTDLSYHGNYSWGVINTGARDLANADEFTFHNTNGVIGIETSAQVTRLLQLRVAY